MHLWIAHTEEQARCAKVPRTCAIFGTFYARCICVYWPASCYTEEQASVLVETHASSMHGQYQGTGMQGAYIMPY